MTGGVGGPRVSMSDPKDLSAMVTVVPTMTCAVKSMQEPGLVLNPGMKQM